MPIYPRGNAYLVCVGSGSDRFRKTCKTLKEAEQVESDELERRRGHSGRTQSTQEPRSKGNQGGSLGHTLSEAYTLTVQDVWSQRRSDAHVKSAGSVLKTFGSDTLVHTITTSVIREAVEEWEDQGNTGSTINRKLSALSMMLKTAADEGWIETLPRIKRRSAGTHRIRWLDAQEELEVLSMCDKLGLKALREFIIVAVDTGFRRMELLDFSVKDYRKGMLHLHPDQTKTAKARSVPATSRVHAIIEGRRGNSRLFDDLTESKLRDQWTALREAMGKLDDPQFVVHMLRHTCASRLAMQDKTAQFIQEWMGHATPLTTARYMHLSNSKLKEGTTALDDFRIGVNTHLRLVTQN